MPEVRDAAVIQGVPMHAGSFLTSFSVEGRPDTPVDRPSGRIRVVSPGYFGVMNIPILSGRDYDEHDEVGEVGSLPSVIVNRTLAERFWPGQDAVGKRVRMSWKSSPSMIIGVVGDVRYTGLDADAGNEFYLPEGLYPQSAITLLVRTDRDPLPLYPDMRRRIADIDKDAFVFDVKPMTQLIAESLAPRRFSTILLSAFAVVALILSLAGIYAVIAHSVAQRTVEIGIRIAMGASPARVTGLMLRYGLLPVDLRNGCRMVRRICDFAIVFGHAVRRRAARPSDVDPRFRRHARCGVHRELPACASRRSRRSDRRAPATWVSEWAPLPCATTQEFTAGKRRSRGRAFSAPHPGWPIRRTG